MADYTKTNLKEIDDSAVAYGLSPNLEARFARKPLGLEGFGLSYQRLAPNFRSPFGHRHAEQEEVYVILSGGGRMKLEEEVVELRPLDAVRVPAETTRALEAGPDGLELVAFGVGAGGDTELHEGWWSDGAS